MPLRRPRLSNFVGTLLVGLFSCKADPNLQTGVFTKTATSVGDVGGGTDSIALWLSILGLILLPVASLAGGLYYAQILRPRRIARQVEEQRNGTHAGV